MADEACDGRTLARVWYLEATFEEGTVFTSVMEERKTAAPSMLLNAGCIPPIASLTQYIFAGMHICTLIGHCNHDDVRKNSVF